MYKSLLDKVSRGRNLPPKRAAFFMAGDNPGEMEDIWNSFASAIDDFADPCCCAGRWPGRVGRCQSAGGLRLGQPWLQKPGYEAAHGGRRHHPAGHHPDPSAVRPVLR